MKNTTGIVTRAAALLAVVLLAGCQQDPTTAGQTPAKCNIPRLTNDLAAITGPTVGLSASEAATKLSQSTAPLHQIANDAGSGADAQQRPGDKIACVVLSLRASQALAQIPAETRIAYNEAAVRADNGATFCTALTAPTGPDVTSCDFIRTQRAILPTLQAIEELKAIPPGVADPRTMDVSAETWRSISVPMKTIRSNVSDSWSNSVDERGWRLRTACRLYAAVSPRFNWRSVDTPGPDDRADALIIPYNAIMQDVGTMLAPPSNNTTSCANSPAPACRLALETQCAQWQ